MALIRTRNDTPPVAPNRLRARAAGGYRGQGCDIRRFGAVPVSEPAAHRRRFAVHGIPLLAILRDEGCVAVAGIDDLNPAQHLWTAIRRWEVPATIRAALIICVLAQDDVIGA